CAAFMSSSVVKYIAILSVSSDHDEYRPPVWKSYCKYQYDIFPAHTLSF
uniref:Uncharacterized protein n=1 Tax=Amphilophus citrinellus TaxID=61819 RepID=A0A3Q0SCR1_AMPCI